MRIAIIANPAAGRGRLFRNLQDYVRDWDHPGWDVEILPTRAPGHAGVLTRELLDRPPDILAVCGGDGTINEVISVLPSVPPCPVAVLPGGTANVLARELGLPLDPIQALGIALKGKTRLVDIGEMHAIQHRRFAFVAGIGFDAWAVHEARPTLKSRIGIVAYAVAVAECLLNYKFPQFEIAANGSTYIATSCLICNARSYGGGLSFCPDADMTDGLLDVLILEGVRRTALMSFLLSAWVLPGRTPAWARRLQAKRLRIEGPSSVYIETDGELVGTLPAIFSLSGKFLPLIVR